MTDDLINDQEDGDREYKYWLWLVETEYKTAADLDKALLTLSAGAIAVSVTFSQALTKGAAVGSKALLFSSWLGFGLSLIMVLWSHVAAQQSLRHLRKRLVSKELPEKSPAFGITQRLNHVAMLAFLWGVLFFAWFIFVNLSEGGK
jgi:hypothetical protein